MESNTKNDDFAYISGGKGERYDELMKYPNLSSSSLPQICTLNYKDEEINGMSLREMRKRFKSDPKIYSDLMKRRRRVQKRYNTASHRMKEKRSQLKKERKDLLREIAMWQQLKIDLARSMGATSFHQQPIRTVYSVNNIPQNFGSQ